jgi:hypothetical protein
MRGVGHGDLPLFDYEANYVTGGRDRAALNAALGMSYDVPENLKGRLAAGWEAINTYRNAYLDRMTRRFAELMPQFRRFTDADFETNFGSLFPGVPENVKAKLYGQMRETNPERFLKTYENPLRNVQFSSLNQVGTQGAYEDLLFRDDESKTEMLGEEIKRLLGEIVQSAKDAKEAAAKEVPVQERIMSTLDQWMKEGAIPVDVRDEDAPDAREQ